MNPATIVAVALTGYVIGRNRPAKPWVFWAEIAMAAAWTVAAVARATDGEWMQAVVDAGLAVASVYLAWRDRPGRPVAPVGGDVSWMRGAA